MAADMHIHIFDNITEGDLANFFSNTLGSKWFNPRPAIDDRRDKAYEKVFSTPDIWIGEVSWLKAGLFDDPETFVPDPVGKINEVIGEDLPVITDELIDRIIEAFELENTTGWPRLMIFVRFWRRTRARRLLLLVGREATPWDQKTTKKP